MFIHLYNIKISKFIQLFNSDKKQKDSLFIILRLSFFILY